MLKSEIIHVSTQDRQTCLSSTHTKHNRRISVNKEHIMVTEIQTESSTQHPNQQQYSFTINSTIPHDQHTQPLHSPIQHIHYHSFLRRLRRPRYQTLLSLQNHVLLLRRSPKTRLETTQEKCLQRHLPGRSIHTPQERIRSHYSTIQFEFRRDFRGHCPIFDNVARSNGCFAAGICW